MTKPKDIENKYSAFYDVGDGVYEVWNKVYNEFVAIIKKHSRKKSAVIFHKRGYLYNSKVIYVWLPGFRLS